jgi:hypothetical protein
MQVHNDESPFDWIRLGRNEMALKDVRWVGTFVSNIIPPAFDSYAKVLHRIDAHYKNIDEPLTQSEIAILKIPPCEELKAFVEDRRTNAQGSRVRWRDVADVAGVPFAPEINHAWYRKRLAEGCWPRFLRGPDEGLLDAEECAEVASVLRPFTGIGECFFRFAEIPLLGTDRPLLFSGALDHLGELIESGAYQFSPEYWWPGSRKWCVCSDYDLEFTVVGGSRELTSALLASDVLECLEVTPLTRVDSFAPIP